MSLIIGKPVNIPNAGLSGISVPAPVSKNLRAQFNIDGSLTVLVAFYENQDTMDTPNSSPFLTKSYTISAIPALENMINTGLKLLPDFDAAT